MCPDKLTFWVEWSEEDQEFVGRCKEYPSLSVLERQKAEALKGILQIVVVDLETEGE